MLIIEHRVNWIDRGPNRLLDVPAAHGVEIDVRHDPATDRLYLSHDPLSANELKSASYLDDYLQVLARQGNALVVFNLKEMGIEPRCVALAAKYGLPPEKYFFLDAEFFFIYGATRGTRPDEFKTRSIAVRFSEGEPLEMALAQKGYLDWVWIDTETKLPLDSRSASELMQNFKTCLVSPDRRRPNQAMTEIPHYREQMAELGFRLDAVMVGKEYIHLWQ